MYLTHGSIGYEQQQKLFENQDILSRMLPHITKLEIIQDLKHNEHTFIWFCYGQFRRYNKYYCKLHILNLSTLKTKDYNIDMEIKTTIDSNSYQPSPIEVSTSTETSIKSSEIKKK